MGGSVGPHRVRAFLAVPVPEAQRQSLAAHLEECGRLAPGYRWVLPQNLHLTLRFLGGLDPATVERLRGDLRRVRASPFRLALDGRDAFGPRSSPRVVWLSVSEGAQDCAALAACLERSCRATGLEPEPRPFRAHLTLARARPGAPRLPTLPEPPALESWTVEDFILYESRLGGRAAAYVPLERYPLRPE